MKYLDNLMYKLTRIMIEYESVTGKNISMLVITSISIVVSILVATVLLLTIKYLPVLFLIILALLPISAIYRLIKFIIFVIERRRESRNETIKNHNNDY